MANERDASERAASETSAGRWEAKDLGSSGRAWLCPRPARLHAVFVHGFQGDHQETWTYRPPREWRRLFRRPAHKGILLFDLLGEDASLDCNYYSISHEARILSPTNLRSAADILRTFLSNYVPPAEPVALVAHSFGGLACRLAILDLIR